MKVAYRSGCVSTAQARDRFNHIARLGVIHNVKGYRFEALRGLKTDSPWRNTFERVMVYGQFGTARFDGYRATTQLHGERRR